MNLSKNISDPVDSPASVHAVDIKLPEMIVKCMFIKAVVVLLKKKKVFISHFVIQSVRCYN